MLSALSTPTMDDVEPIALLAVLAAYLVGSLPIGLLVGLLRGVDLRRHGSGNIGATNAGRVLGRRWFFLVFVLDFLKSFAPVVVVLRLDAAWCGTGSGRSALALAVGVAAVLGHVFPLFLRFRGGKGVATAAGVFAALAPLPALAALLVWIVVAKASGYVSLASLAAAVALPLCCFLLPEFELPRAGRVAVAPPVRWAALAVGALIVWRHRGNIGRLRRGEEPRSHGSAS
jgi:glycerol-3-phosphate acyltransferase PlsY